ncbi:NRF1 [Branchiostoma lanceolatum]|uniref:NRF1 protein n=1 Tax=Branchiostoma lanceolatum TaxID=7740 RepID=A0A8K0A1J8_BRALA|nr:NRF1 [Branchiostoma lanceolatum]
MLCLESSRVGGAARYGSERSVTMMINEMMSDAMRVSDASSDEGGNSFDDSGLLSPNDKDEVTAQLANAGPVGVAAAAAIATGRKRKRPHQFETNPSIRKRQQTRLTRKLKNLIDEYIIRVGQKLKNLIDEYIIRVGQQVVVLCCLLVKLKNLIDEYIIRVGQKLKNLIDEYIIRVGQQAVVLKLKNLIDEYIIRVGQQAVVKLKNLIDEYIIRVGQQAVVLCCTPGKPEGTFKVFGAAPLDSVVRNCRQVIMQDLEAALAQQAPPPQSENPHLHELPPLVIEGIPVPVDKMTQAQLRAFIPIMLKYSTGRGKPGWGKEATRPVWWPSDLPWANVRSDVRTEEQKQQVSWTHALRTIVKNCYKHHGREDLMMDAEIHSGTDSQQPTTTQLQVHQVNGQLMQPHTMVQTINNPDGTVSLIQVDTGATVATLTDASAITVSQQGGDLQGERNTYTWVDGTVSSLVDGGAIAVSQQPMTVVTPNFQTLNTAHPTVTITTQNTQAEATQAVATLAEVAAATQGETGHEGLTQAHITPVSVQVQNEAAAQGVATLAEATLSDGSQIMLSTEGALDATGQEAGGVVIPVTMYQSVVSSVAQQQHQQHQQQQQQQHQQQQAQAQQVTTGVPQVAMVPDSVISVSVTQANESSGTGDVPMATHAVEVVTLEQAQQ